MVYVSARTDPCLGLENLDTIITIVSSEMFFPWSSFRVKTSWLVRTLGWLTGFCMMQCFADENFRTVYDVCPKTSLSQVSCRAEASLLVCFIYGMGFYWEYFSKGLFNRSYCFIYLNCHWIFKMFFDNVEDICGVQLLGVYYFYSYYYHHYHY